MRRLLRPLLVAVLLAAAPACTVRGRAVYVVDVRPPPIPTAVIVTARPGWVWIDGHWAWIDSRWTWQPGYWVRERPGHVWRPGGWVQVGTRWHWHAGRWDRHHRPAPARPHARPRVQDHR